MMARSIFPAIAAVLLLSHRGVAGLAQPVEPGRIDTLNAIGGLPAHLVAGLYEPVGFVETSRREFLVLDRRAHMVYGIDAAKTRRREVLKIGLDKDNVLEPAVLSLGPGDLFAVSDAEWGTERIQYFNVTGLWVGGFHLPTKVAPRLVVNSIVVNGAGSMQFMPDGFLINQPESGELITQLDLDGRVVRRFGVLRATGHEGERDLHLAFNVGIPLTTGDGGAYFVFRTGVPIIRKYNATGALVFERHIEGPELDAAIQSLPTVWPRRSASEGELPIVPPLVLASAVDRAGRLWVSTTEQVTYVYDARGEKVRTVRFKGASILAPNSFFFTTHDTVLVTPGCYEFAVPTRPSAP
jgi:hypothetical protein